MYLQCKDWNEMMYWLETLKVYFPKLDVFMSADENRIYVEEEAERVRDEIFSDKD